MEHHSNTALLERTDTELELSTGDGDNNERNAVATADGDIDRMHLFFRKTSDPRKMNTIILEARASGEELTATCGEIFIASRVEQDNPPCPECMQHLASMSDLFLDQVFWIK